MEHLKLSFRAYDGYNVIEVYNNSQTNKREYWVFEENENTGEYYGNIKSEHERFPFELINKKLMQLEPIKVSKGLQPVFLNMLNRTILKTDGTDESERFFKVEFLAPVSKRVLWEKVLDVVWVQKAFQFLTQEEYTEYKRTGEL